MDTLSFERYVRTPFVVEATIINEENIDEIAKLVGVDGVARERNGEKFIALDRRVIPNVNRAFIGWYFTKMDDNYRCYSPKLFKDLFVEVGDKTEIAIQFTNDNATV